jgi:phenylacetate-CoA ligase
MVNSVAARLGYQLVRLGHVAALLASVPGAVARLDWPADRLLAERERLLRRLLAYAKARSPWHARRLAGIDPADFAEARIRELPVMTKADLMENFDQVVTDRRVTLEDANRHLASLKEDRYFLGSQHVVASGGSTGRRGVFVYDGPAWVDLWAGMQRYGVRLGCVPSLGSRLRVAQIGADKAVHVINALSQTFSTPLLNFRRFPVAMPFPEMVAGLQVFQPTILQGYPSVLLELAREQEAGRLSISPRAVVAGAEPLLPETRAVLQRVFGRIAHNWWAASETGLLGASCGHGPWMHLTDDRLIIEPVDETGEPVAAGKRAAKLFVTNLFNSAMPLIRFEITDSIVEIPGACPCGSAFRRVADVEGRLEETFLYTGGLVVHPMVFRSVLSNHPDVVDYQVRQTKDGAEVDVVEARPFDRGALETALAAGLARVGLPRPRVSVASVRWLARNVSGKLVRYVRLTAPPTWAVRAEPPSAARGAPDAAPAERTSENSVQISAP